MPESVELRDYGRLLKDGELRIKAHDDQKIRVRYVAACDFFCICTLNLVCFTYLWLILVFTFCSGIVCCQLTKGNVFLYLFQICIHL